MEFSPCQIKARDLLFSQASNCFITGGAGVGKSFLLKSLMEQYKSASNELAVLASTGAAAVIMSGRTFHSFFGLTPKILNSNNAIEEVLENKRLVKRIEKSKLLVLDEVSMLSGDVLALGERIARTVKDPNKVWGGLTVYACGDFAQLPPVGLEKDWAFMHEVWDESQFLPILLKTPMRTQSLYFQKVLEKIRWANIDDEVKSFLESRVNLQAPSDSTKIFPYKQKVSSFNKQMLAQIQSEKHEFETKLEGQVPYTDYLIKNAPIDMVLELKVGALVMTRVNDPMSRFVNGSVGVIQKIHKDCVEVKINNRLINIEPFTFSYLNGEGKVMATMTNFPLSLAWAMTIHKAQGATLNQVEVDLKGLWETGQAYVALSRVRSEEDVFINHFCLDSFKFDQRVFRFYEEGCPYHFRHLSFDEMHVL